MDNIRKSSRHQLKTEFDVNRNPLKRSKTSPHTPHPWGSADFSTTAFVTSILQWCLDCNILLRGHFFGFGIRYGLACSSKFVVALKTRSPSGGEIDSVARTKWPIVLWSLQNKRGNCNKRLIPKRVSQFERNAPIVLCPNSFKSDKLRSTNCDQSSWTSKFVKSDWTSDIKLSNEDRKSKLFASYQITGLFLSYSILTCVAITFCFFVRKGPLQAPQVLQEGSP